jgi:spermidine/putrescine-binding protein
MALIFTNEPAKNLRFEQNMNIHERQKIVKDKQLTLEIIDKLHFLLLFCSTKMIIWLIVFTLASPTLVFCEDKTLRMLIWEGYAPTQQITKFEAYIAKKYHIKLTVVVSHVSNSDSFFDPIRSKDVDIISPTYHMFKDQRWGLLDKGLILSLNLDNIPNFKYISISLQNAGYMNRNGKVYATPLAQGPYGLVYNTKFVKTPPKSWNILWNPAFKNKYVIAKNEYMHNCMLTALSLGYSPDHIHEYDHLNNIEFKEKLGQLARNAHSFWDGTDKADDLFGHSLATSWGFALKDLKDRNEIWKIASPNEGTVFWVDNYAITWSLKDKPLSRKIAEEWLNYTLTPEFQIEVIMRNLNSYPVTTNIQNWATVEEIKQFHLDAPEAYQKKRISERDLSLRDRNGLKLLWDNALKWRNP